MTVIEVDKNNMEELADLAERYCIDLMRVAIKEDNENKVNALKHRYKRIQQIKDLYRLHTPGVDN